jgi:hypothetical protein
MSKRILISIITYSSAKGFTATSSPNTHNNTAAIWWKANKHRNYIRVHGKI